LVEGIEASERKADFTINQIYIEKIKRLKEIEDPDTRQ